MNQSVYSFAIFIAGLSVLTAFFHSIIYLQLGSQVFTLPSFPVWYAFMNLVSISLLLILLKYYHYKKYKFAFWAGMVSTTTALLQFIIVYNLLTGTSALGVYYDSVILSVMGASIVYAISLIFSHAGARPWLKAAGIFTFIFGLILISTFIWGISPPDAQKYAMSENIHQWITLAGSLIPLLFILNFLSEIKILRKESADSSQPLRRSVASLMVAACLIAVATTLYIGPMIGKDSYRLINWNKNAPEREKRLAEPFEARIFVSSQGDTLRYRLFKPVNYDTTKKYPLVVCLHHGGSHGTDNIKQIDGAQPAQLLYQHRTKYPAFLFVPQCPPGTNWGGIPGYFPIDSLVFEAIRALEDEFAIDAKRRYVTGISMGGFGSWHFISIHPEMFAAAIPICGGGAPTFANDIKNVAVWAFHGEKDTNVPVTRSREMIEAMKKTGGNPQYTEFPDAGHNIWDNVKNTPGIMDWLFKQKRD